LINTHTDMYMLMEMMLHWNICWITRWNSLCVFIDENDDFFKSRCWVNDSSSIYI